MMIANLKSSQSDVFFPFRLEHSDGAATIDKTGYLTVTLEELYKQYFEDYYEKLYSYAFTILKDNAEAKDIVQSAFIKLWEKRNVVNFEISGRAYLYTSVYNLAMNSLRNSKRREGHHFNIEEKKNTNVTYQTEQKQIRELIQSEIDLLPERCKETFYKSKFEGKKYSVIAAEMDISIKTVEVHMGKALKILRERLAHLVPILGGIFFL